MRIRRALPRESDEPLLTFTLDEETIATTQKRRTTLTLTGGDDDRLKGAKTYRQLTSVLTATCSNAEVYDRVLSPLVARVIRGETACCFAYGHTGSGKTHTVLGYGTEAGLHRHAATALTSAIAATTLQLQVRCAELYQGKLYDLLSDRAECFLREDATGQVHIRSSTQMDAQGRVRVQSLTAEYARHAEDVNTLVQRAVSSRAVGNSSLHAQSSRSHAFIELQLVSPAVVCARLAVLNAEATLVPIGKARDGKFISISSRCYAPHPTEKGAWIENRAAVPESEHQELQQLELDVKNAEEVLRQARRKEQLAVREAAMLLRSASPSVSQSAENYDGDEIDHWECGTMVLVDLAGAEYAPHPTEKGAWIENRAAVPESEHQELQQLELDVKNAEEVLRQARRKEQLAVREAAMLLRSASPSVSQSAENYDGDEIDHWECGTMVLVDLAGAEYATLDAVRHGGVRARSAQELTEGREINSSLLSLKECMRSLSRGAAHIPFRNSKLTLLLRRYLRAEAASAVMIATVSPTASQASSTENTLQYAALLADTIV